MSDIGLYRREGSPYWWVKCSVNGKPIRRSLKTSDLTEARKRRDLLVSRAQVDGLHVRTSAWQIQCRNAMEDSQSWLRRLWASANARNRRKGAREISLESVYRIALKSGGRCAVTGIEFRWSGAVPVSGAYGISIDRIDSSKPYSRGNCRMVLRAVNFAMNAWGASVFWDVATHAVGRKLISASAESGAQENAG